MGFSFLPRLSVFHRELMISMHDPYCIVKIRPAESVHLVYQLLLEGATV